MSVARRNPYVGPRPFLSRDEAFFGRDAEAAQLRDSLAAYRVVLLYSPSGAGKTSLINARLIPDLEEAEYEVLLAIRIASPPLSSENRYVTATMQALDQGLNEDERLALPRSEIGLYLEARRRDPDKLLLLIFDQFEDVLTHDPTDEGGRVGFFSQLGSALADYSMYALFSMREEYVPALDPYLHLMPNRLSARMRMTGLSEEGAIKAVSEPARLEGVEFDKAAAADLVKALQMTRVIGPDGKPEEKRGREVEGLQLQVVCDRIWRGLAPDQTSITSKDLVRSGGTTDAADTVEAALSAYYASVIDRIAADKTNASERTLRKWFQRRLITGARLRAQVMQGDEQSQGLTDGVLKQLIDSGLVRAETRRGVRWFELAHDRFIDPVLDSNAEWFKANPNPIEHHAALWQNEGRPRRLLLEVEKLAEVERWARIARIEDKVESDFLQASLEQRDAQTAEAERAKAVERRTNLADLGWGIIFANDDQSVAIREEMEELLEHRKREAGPLYKWFRYSEGQTARTFLLENGVGSGPLVPDKVPYYLLIAAPPHRIPFEFQYGFGAQYAVGRISFDTAGDYRRYAQSVVRCETAGASVSRRLSIFGPTHERDPATQMVNRVLFAPVSKRLAAGATDWSVTSVLGEEATKTHLTALLAQPQTALLWAGGHSATTEKSPDSLLNPALVCAGWSPGHALGDEPLFSSADIPEDVTLEGKILFLMMGFSAGMPTPSDFDFKGRSLPAPRKAGVSAFAKRLLAHANGAALAVIGHVDQLWSFSFEEGKGVAQLSVFEGMVRRLMDGHTVGSAMEVFRQRYLLLSSQVAGELLLPKVLNREPITPRDASPLTAMLDLRNYVIVGDPAARLRFAGESARNQPSFAPSAREAPADQEALVLTFNGIDAASGDYAMTPISAASFVTRMLDHTLEVASL